MEDHVNWPTQMGARVLINDGWYERDLCADKALL
jgi:hypothetical protein